jgi:hypothetical protein
VYALQRDMCGIPPVADYFKAHEAPCPAGIPPRYAFLTHKVDARALDGYEAVCFAFSASHFRLIEVHSVLSGSGAVFPPIRNLRL